MRPEAGELEAWPSFAAVVVPRHLHVALLILKGQQPRPRQQLEALDQHLTPALGIQGETETCMVSPSPAAPVTTAAGQVRSPRPKKNRDAKRGRPGFAASRRGAVALSPAPPRGARDTLAPRAGAEPRAARRSGRPACGSFRVFISPLLHCFPFSFLGWV